MIIPYDTLNDGDDHSYYYYRRTKRSLMEL